MEDGNAQSAKTTTLRDEKSAIDARKLEPSKISPENLFIYSRMNCNQKIILLG